VIYGAGAIGGTIGARLFQAGHDVALVARGEHLDALQRKGLTLRSPEEDVTLPIPAVESPEAAGLSPGDVVLLAMKTQHTAGAVATLARAAPPGVAVACAQNGVENERIALRSFPDVYAICVMLPAAHLEPGVVEPASTPITGLLDIGRYPVGVDAKAEEISAAFAGATFSSGPRPDIMRWKYRKLLLNLGNAVEAVTGTAGWGSPAAERLMKEGDAVLRAAGIECASVEEDRERRGDLLRPRPVGGREQPRGSSWQSLVRGVGSIEADYFNGEIALLGRLHGVPTPANDMLQHLADRFAAERRPPGALTADELEERLAAV
jgi:2-dehydropantoate 2-reductase